MKPLSIRARLALWNMAALAALFVAFGGVLRTFARSTILGSIDRELLLRTRPLLEPPHPAPRPPLEKERGDADQEPRPPAPEGEPRFGGLPFEFRGGPGPDEPGRPPRPNDRPADDGSPASRPPLRPRLYDVQGQPFNPRDPGPWDTKAVANAFESGQPVFSYGTQSGEPLRLLTRRFPMRPPFVGTVQVAYPLTEARRAVEGIDTAFLLFVPVALVGAGLAGMVLTGVMLRPIRRLTQTAARVGADDLSERLSEAGGDEFAELSRTFNGMLGRLESAFQRQERLIEQQRRFTADASHELKTPLTIVRGNADFLRSDPALDADQRQSAEDIHAAAGRMSRLVQDLLLLARSDAGQLGRDRVTLHLADLLARAAASANRREGAAVTIAVEPPDLCIHGAEDELARLFSNLLDNALRHTRLDGRVIVTARREVDWTVVDVTDTGPGVPPEHLPHLGERFYRVDASRTRAGEEGGTGLGLSICRSIAEAHGGTLTFHSEPGSGLTAIVRLPNIEGDPVARMP